MATWLKQATTATIKLGPFLNEADGKTAETALTIAQADLRLSKNGGALAQSNNAAGATHDALGYYDVPLDATDTGTLGRLRVAVHKSGALPVWQDFLVVPANVYDSIVLGADKLDVSLVEWLGTAPNVLQSARVDAYVGAYGGGLTPPSAAAIATAVHDEVVDGTRTLRQLVRGWASALLGKASGLNTTTATYRDVGDTKNRIVATVDADGNRTAVTLDLT